MYFDFSKNVLFYHLIFDWLFRNYFQSYNHAEMFMASQKDLRSFSFTKFFDNLKITESSISLNLLVITANTKSGRTL